MKWVKRQDPDMKNLRSTSRRPELLLDLVALDRKSHDRFTGNSTFAWSNLIMDGSLPFDGRLPSSRALARKSTCRATRW